MAVPGPSLHQAGAPGTPHHDSGTRPEQAGRANFSRTGYGHMRRIPGGARSSPGNVVPQRRQAALLP